MNGTRDNSKREPSGLGSVMARIGRVAMAVAALGHVASADDLLTCDAARSSLLAATGIVLESERLTVCPSCDRNGDGRVTVDELVRAATDACRSAGSGVAPTAPSARIKAAAVRSVDVGTAIGLRGQPAAFAVALHASDVPVAAMQNDISFDAIETPIAAAGSLPDCVVNPAINKSLFVGFLPAGCVGSACTSMRALMFSFTTPNDPIPDGSILYTCNVNISSTAALGSHPLLASNTIFAFPVPPGGQIPGVTSSDGDVLVVTVLPTPTETATPTTTPTPSQTPTPTLPLIRGDRKNPARDRSGCQVEWRVMGPNAAADRDGLPSEKQSCEDGDPNCDGKPNAAGICEFQVMVCFNNTDAKLPACIPNGLRSVSVLSPRADLARVPRLQTTLAADADALHAAIEHLRDPMNPGSGFDKMPPLDASQQNFCSAPFPIDVLTGPVSAVVTLMTRSFDNSLPQPLLRRSRLKLICKARRLP